MHHIVVTAGGSGYTNGDFTGVDILGDGQNGECTVTVSGGSVTKIVVTTAGSGYKRASIDIQSISGIGSGVNALQKLSFHH